MDASILSSPTFDAARLTVASGGHGLSLPGGEQPLGVVLLIMLAIAALAGAVLKRLRIEAIPGYLLAGALVGPHALRLIRSESSVDQISELALVLLLFGIGLHIDAKAMQRGMVRIVLLSIVSTLLSVAMLLGVLLALRVPMTHAIILAMGGGISSTAVMVRMLASRREIDSSHGRVTVGVSIVQDLISVIMLAIVPVIVALDGQVVGLAPEPSTIPPWLQNTLRAMLSASGVFLLLLIGQRALPFMLARVASVRSTELMVVTAGAIALLWAVLTTLLGLGPAMGAFLAGYLLASTDYRFQLAGQFAPLRDLLMAVFFVSVGLRVSPPDVLASLPAILLLTCCVVVLKGAIIAGCAYLAGMTAPAGSKVGVYLGNAGEFSLVVIGAGAAILSKQELGSSIAVVILSLIATPFMVPLVCSWGERLSRLPLSPLVARSMRSHTPHAPALLPLGEDEHAAVTAADVIVEQVGEQGDATPIARPTSVVIAGFGPVGRTLADRFAVQGVQTTVIELNASTVQRQHQLGRRIVYGDVTNRDVLEHAGVMSADAVILTVPDEEATLKAVQVVRELRPDVFVAARSRVLSSKFAMMTLGADVVTVEEVSTAVAMEREVLDSLSRWLSKRK